jgi:Domain of unknown function (DUF397)
MTEPDWSRAVWRKSVSSSANNECVEVAGNLHGVVAVRDSKDPRGPRIVFSAAEWRTFARRAKAGHFDLA